MKGLLIVSCWAMTALLLAPFPSVFGQEWEEVHKLLATDRRAGDLLGSSATIDGNFAALGAPGESGDPDPIGAGAVYIFERDLGASLGDCKWVQVQKLTAPDRTAGSSFGSGVSVSGNFLIVGAELDGLDENGEQPIKNAGSAYIYKRDGAASGNGSWTLMSKVVANDRNSNDGFGSSVAIDGTVAVVGSSNYFDADGLNEMTRSGAAYVYELEDGSNWKFVQKLVALDRHPHSTLGRVSVSGSWVFVGSSGHYYDANGMDSLKGAGAAYFFERDAAAFGSGTYVQRQKVSAPDRQVGDQFGISTTIDGDYAAVGAWFQDFGGQTGDDTLSNAGAVYFYERDVNGTGNWVLVQKVAPPDRDEFDLFGTYVNLSEDRLVGSSLYNDLTISGGFPHVNSAGATYIYRRDSLSPLGSGVWDFEQKLAAIDRAPKDFFGIAEVSGNFIVAGAYGKDQGSNLVDMGAGYIFKICEEELADTLVDTACASYTSPSGKYTWTSSGDYLDTLLTNTCCDSIIPIDLTVLERDDASFGFQPSAVCNNSPIDPIPVLMGDSGGVFSVFPSGTIDPVTGAVALNSVGAGSFEVTYVTEGHCPDTQQVTLTVSAPGNATISTRGPFCTNQIDTLEAATAGGHWIGTALDSTTGVFEAASAGAGTHQIIYLLAEGCADADTIDVEVHTPALVGTSPDTSIAYGSTVVLRAFGGGEYLWSPDDAVTCSTCAATFISPTQQTTYQVTITDTNGCRQEETVGVSIIIPTIPGALSPNGDGIHDTWEIGDLEAYPANEVRIYTRWGTPVLFARPYENAWDGERLPEGSYYYVIDLGGGAPVLKGYVVLVRE